MNAHILPLASDRVLAAIEDHRQAFEAEEALYDGDGKPLAGKDLLATAERRVRDSFRAIVKMSCETNRDVQTKLTFLFEGVTSRSEPVLSAILNDDYADEEFQGTGGYELHDQFLRSLWLHRRE